jgi:hypothetical protein
MVNRFPPLQNLLMPRRTDIIDGTWDYGELTAVLIGLAQFGTVGLSHWRALGFSPWLENWLLSGLAIVAIAKAVTVTFDPFLYFRF